MALVYIWFNFGTFTELPDLLAEYSPDLLVNVCENPHLQERKRNNELGASELDLQGEAL